MQLGPLGVWSSFDGVALAEAGPCAQRVEGLGYSALWHPMSLARDELLVAAQLLQATERLIVATGIATIYSRSATWMAAAQRTLDELSGGRFLLGLGVSHPVIVESMQGLEYGPPVATMRAYLDRMDANPALSLGRELGVKGDGAEQAAAASAPPRVLAALGPRMLALARERARGAHPYLMPVSHTERARKLLGPDRWLCVELKVVLETEPTRAREIGRGATFPNITLPNYQRTWLELGYEEADFQDGGSDRFVDAVIAWGSPADVEARVREHLDAGADHVCIQPVHPGGRAAGIHWETLEALAPGRP